LSYDYVFVKVIIGAHAVMANGGVIAAVGSHMVALAAHHHAVPFVVLAGLHKVRQTNQTTLDLFSS
jgi:translation initiation factor 2B subunit (eIF-2B alpha/beta/delta family)